MAYARSKYRAKKAEYAGENYDSKAEAAYAAHLDSLIERGEILYYVRQPKFCLGVPENVYRPDFHVVAQRWTSADDVKGAEPPAFKKNRRLWAKYGTCPLRVIRLNLRYPKAVPGVDSTPLPAIKGIDFDVVHGGRERRSYGPLHPEWLRRS
jgi:hypothetical protein